jgi:hypothetical protein
LCQEEYEYRYKHIIFYTCKRCETSHHICYPTFEFFSYKDTVYSTLIIVKIVIIRLNVVIYIFKLHFNVTSVNQGIAYRKEKEKEKEISVKGFGLQSLAKFAKGVKIMLVKQLMNLK